MEKTLNYQLGQNKGINIKGTEDMYTVFIELKSSKHCDVLKNANLKKISGII